MQILEQLQELYRVYEAQAEAAKAKSPYFARVLGMGNDYRNHPCNDQFDEGVEKALQEFLASDPDGETAGQVLAWVLMTAADHKGQATYWYLYAMHRFALPLIELAEPALCADLQERYNKAYPRIERMPAQAAVYKALGKRAKKG